MSQFTIVGFSFKQSLDVDIPEDTESSNH